MNGHPRLSLSPGKRSRSANNLGAVAEWRGPHAGGSPPNCPHWPPQFNPEMPLQAAWGGDTQTGSPRLGMISGCQLKLKGRRFSVPRSTCFVPPQLQTWAPPGPSGPGSLSFVAVAQPHLFHLSVLMGCLLGVPGRRAEAAQPAWSPPAPLPALPLACRGHGAQASPCGPGA